MTGTNNSDSHSSSSLLPRSERAFLSSSLLELMHSSKLEQSSNLKELPHECDFVASAARMVFAASHGSEISINSQRPNPPWLLTASTQRSRAVETFAALSLRGSPLTSTMRFRRLSRP